MLPSILPDVSDASFENFIPASLFFTFVYDGLGGPLIFVGRTNSGDIRRQMEIEEAPCPISPALTRPGAGEGADAPLTL
jgi:hypothetical protein